MRLSIVVVCNETNVLGTCDETQSPTSNVNEYIVNEEERICIALLISHCYDSCDNWRVAHFSSQFYVLSDINTRTSNWWFNSI